MQDLDPAPLTALSSYHALLDSPPGSTLTFLQFLRHAALIATSGSLHFQNPLSAPLFPTTFTWLPQFHHLSVGPNATSSERSSLATLRKKLTLPSHSLRSYFLHSICHIRSTLCSGFLAYLSLSPTSELIGMRAGTASRWVTAVLSAPRTASDAEQARPKYVLSRCTNE